jgi:hypothetical protein
MLMMIKLIIISNMNGAFDSTFDIVNHDSNEVGITIAD